jgi:asparagine synthase (glutamine-hydrolysing)
MCGICGKLSWAEPPDRAVVERMSAEIAHRGPDGEGIMDLGPIVLGHRRLAIIDLSAAAGQPMSDVSGKYWVVFNGEIYNFLSLRQELVGLGAQFRSRSDTEVILEAYKQWGTDCLPRLNGMFAFALWDSRARRLILGRDRLGKKPLFYYLFPDGGISFASGLKSLCEDRRIPRRLNPASLNHYLSLNYTLTAETMILGVRKLPAAHFLVVEEGKAPRQDCYWDLAESFRRKRSFRSEAEAAEELTTLVDDAVRLRLISDVPLGVFLSGGIDSSTIVASMCQQHPSREVHSFSIGFQEKSYNELAEARRVAEALGVTHRDQVVMPDAMELLPRIAARTDEPFADTSIIPMYLLAEFSRQQVTVCLSGDGGDEVFAGYETYTADRLHHLVRGLPSWFIQSLGRAFDRLWPVSYDKVSFDYKVRQFLEGAAYPPMRAHYHWRTIFSEQEKSALLPVSLQRITQADPFTHFSAYEKDVADCHYLDRGMYVDIKTWLVDDILVKADRATMAHALEARAPFLDYRVVEFAASLPVNLKMKAFQKKYLLKRSQRERLPARVLHRAKQGFNAPVAFWLAEGMRERYSNLIVSPDSPVPFNREYVERLWTEHETRIQDHSLKLLALISFQLWCQNFGIAQVAGL